MSDHEGIKDIQELENAVLCLLLNLPEFAERITEIDAAWFYTSINRQIFVAAKETYAEFGAVDPVALFMRRGGDYQHYRQICQSFAVSDNFDIYLKMMQDSHNKRLLRQIGRKIADSETGSTTELMQAYEKAIEAVKGGTGNKVITGSGINSLFETVINEKDIVYQTGFSVGASQIDEYLKIRPANYIVIGARPGTGKTSLLVQLCWIFAKRGIKCLFASLEMTLKEIILRFVSMESGIPVSDVRYGGKNVSKSAQSIANLPLFLSDDETSGIDDILILAEKNKVDVLAIDYLQLIETRTETRTKHEELTEINNKIKRFKNRTGITVIVLSQLKVENEKEKPKISDLYESGTTRQSADTAILLWKPVDSGKEDIKINGDTYVARIDDFDIVEFYIGKQRGGMSAISFPIYFNGRLTKFSCVGK